MVTILYRPNSEHERPVLDFQRELVRNQVIVQLVNIDSRDGGAIARLYDIMEFPAVLAIQQDGRLTQTWTGNLPLLSDVTYVAHS